MTTAATKLALEDALKERREVGSRMLTTLSILEADGLPEWSKKAVRITDLVASRRRRVEYKPTFPTGPVSRTYGRAI